MSCRYDCEYIQRIKYVLDRSIHPLLIVREFKIPQIPLDTRDRTGVSLSGTRLRCSLSHLQITRFGVWGKIPGRHALADSVRLHPQLPHNSDTILSVRFLLICVRPRNTSSVASRAGGEELAVPNPAVGVVGGVVVVVDRMFALC